MLDLAGVLGSCLGADTDGDEEVGEELVPFVHLPRYLLSLLTSFFKDAKIKMESNPYGALSRLQLPQLQNQS